MSGTTSPRRRCAARCVARRGAGPDGLLHLAAGAAPPLHPGAPGGHAGGPRLGLARLIGTTVSRPIACRGGNQCLPCILRGLVGQVRRRPRNPRPAEPTGRASRRLPPDRALPERRERGERPRARPAALASRHQAHGGGGVRRRLRGRPPRPRGRDGHHRRPLPRRGRTVRRHARHRLGLHGRDLPDRVLLQRTHRRQPRRADGPRHLEQRAHARAGAGRGGDRLGRGEDAPRTRARRRVEPAVPMPLPATRAALAEALGDTAAYVIPSAPVLESPTVADLWPPSTAPSCTVTPSCSTARASASSSRRCRCRTSSTASSRVPPYRAGRPRRRRARACCSPTTPAPCRPCRASCSTAASSCPPQVDLLIAGLDVRLPIVSARQGTMADASALDRVEGRLTAESARKIRAAAGAARPDSTTPTSTRWSARARRREAAVTPLMFEHDLVERARAAGAHIVLPEGDEERILRAADQVLSRGIARLTLLGDEGEIRPARRPARRRHRRGGGRRPGDQPLARAVRRGVRRRCGRTRGSPPSWPATASSTRPTSAR